MRVLEPEDRRLLTDALRPPEGLELSFAVGTTFTLDLLALLVTPLTFALLDWQEGDAEEAEPLALLEAARRYAERMAIFCHGGYISVPSPDYALFQYLEGSVFECTAPLGGLFHPKIWLLRFTDPTAPDDAPTYRLINQTRNISFDKSWDAFLVLEAQAEPWRERPHAGSQPLGSLVRALPRMARNVSPQVRQQVTMMAREAERTRWSATLPDGFERIRFWTTGLEGATWPFGGDIERALLLSPFLGAEMLERLTHRGRRHVLVSRQESLDALPTDTLARFGEVFVFDDQSAVAAIDPELPDAEPARLPHLAGLHAKVYVAEAGHGASVWIGSLNATDAAWKRNVEFLVELTGPKWRFGVNSLLRENPKTIDFADMLQKYLPPAEPILPPEEEVNAAAAIERGRAAVTAADLSLTVQREGHDWTMRLDGVVEPDRVEHVTITCWPIRSRPTAGRRPLAPPPEQPQWSISVGAITSFVAFEVSVPGWSETFVRNLPLRGAPPDRSQQLLRELLGTPERLLRFLLFLLADGDSSSAAELIAGIGDEATDHEAATFTAGLPLFEALVRALGRSPDKLDHVHRLVVDFGHDQDGKSLLPEGFQAIWDPIWQARESLG
jgi:hypothetical protein